MLFDVASMNLFFAKDNGEHELTFWIIQLFHKPAYTELNKNSSADTKMSNRYILS